MEETGYWEDFIEIYRENPCLWNTKCEDFNNESKKSIAYGLLIEKLWEIDDNADIETVKKKILSFKSNFSREANKIKRCKENGQNYVPTWSYYKSLHFLTSFLFEEDNETAKSNKTQLNTTEISSSTEPPQDTPGDGTLISQGNESTNLSQGKKRRLSNAEDSDREDDCSTFAAHLKTRLRSFDPLQKCIAQKLISDVMFLAETKQLQLATAITNPPGKPRASTQKRH